MLKKYFLCVCLPGLFGCDNVDISKYPEGVQNCYNKTISSTDNCTKSKKIIVKYCECINVDTPEIQTLDDKSGSEILRESLEKQKLRTRCAKETGYTFCNKDEIE